MKVYCLFSSYSDGYTYSSETLIGVYDNEELAYAALIEREDKVKRYNQLREKDKLTTKEQKEYEQLNKINWIHDEFFVEEYKLNEIMKGYENVSC